MRGHLPRRLQPVAPGRPGPPHRHRLRPLHPRLRRARRRRRRAQHRGAHGQRQRRQGERPLRVGRPHPARQPAAAELQVRVLQRRRQGRHSHTFVLVQKKVKIFLCCSEFDTNLGNDSFDLALSISLDSVENPAAD